MSKINNDLFKKLESLPEKPGCYIFYNNKLNVIYVGKAISLQKRVNSYFSKKISNFKTIQLVNDIFDLDFILTKNEKEALLLESNLIKKHKPRYNILLNDDKKYPYIIITKEKDPQIKLTRNKLKNYYYQFGPFPDGTKAYEILKLIKRLYPLKACKGNLSKPCFNYQINQCLGACFKIVDQALYKKNINKIKRFFAGDNINLKKELEIKMLSYANNYQFEEAEKTKVILEKIDFSTSKQFTNIKRIKNTDYVNAVIQDGYLIIIIYFYRNGELLSKDYKIFEYYDLNIENVIRVYLTQLYNKTAPPITLVSTMDLFSLSELFDLKFITGKNNEDKTILNEMLDNAKIFLNLNLRNENNIIGKEILLLKKLQNLAKLKNIPFNLEMYDISNLGKDAQTAGVVVYKNGLPSYNDFRHYNLSGQNNSDYSRMIELINLRYNNKKNPNKDLDLIIVDGSIIQINAVRKTLPEIYQKVDIIGLVKNDKHNTDHIRSEYKENIKIEDRTLFNYLSSIQDKVHNFSISQHKKLLKKKLFE